MATTKVENGDESQSSTPEYRDRLRTWLIKMIDSGTIPGLQWENDEKTIFRMPWKHAGRQDYSLEEDSRIFMAWAIHSGRYREGIDKPEPIIWKTRLRCALNKMPDIREIPEKSRLDISEPYRVYQLLPPVHKDTQIRRRLQRRHSNAQSNETTRLPSHQTSPSFSRKETAGQSSSGQLKFQYPRLQGRNNESVLGNGRPELSPAPWLDIRNTVPAGLGWLGSSPLLPGADNHLLQGLNLNGLTAQANLRNLVNPYSLFSTMPRRDLRRPEFDFPLLPYQTPSIDRPPANPFLMPATSIGGIPFGAKSNVPNITRSLSLANNSPEVVQNSEKTNNVRADEKEEAKCKIELLELEIAKWKRAYEKERLAREDIERKHGHLKIAIENMGENFSHLTHRQNSEKEAKNGSSPPRKPTYFNSEPNSFRRRSADYNNNITADPAHRSGRRSAEEASLRQKDESLDSRHYWIQRENDRRRRLDDDSPAKALDLTSPSPTKRSRNVTSEDLNSSEHRFRGLSASSETGVTTKEDDATGRSFTFSASSRLSSDCDEMEGSVTINTHPPVKSPSASSNCSSAEESVVGAALSPTATRVSPVISMFRSPNTNATYYSGRSDGPIQVT